MPSPRDLLERLSGLARLVGSTPLRCFPVGRGRLCVKLEYVNPTGSHKDRIAVYMLRAALEEEPGLRCVVEASSGNTGVSVAWAAGLLGLEATVFVEPGASEAKKALMRVFGARLVEAGGGEKRRLAAEYAAERGCVFLDQFSNEANYRAHYEWTGGELAEQLGSIDYLYMGVGTGGTIAGVADRLRREGLRFRAVAVVPRGSPVAGGAGAEEPIEGLAGSDVPELYERHRGSVDGVVEVSYDEALRGVAELYRSTGVLAGPSTGAAFYAARGALGEGATVLIIAADHLQRYPGAAVRLAGLLQG